MILHDPSARSAAEFAAAFSKDAEQGARPNSRECLDFDVPCFHDGSLDS